jgi:Glycosyl hydrolase family 14
MQVPQEIAPPARAQGADAPEGCVTPIRLGIKLSGVHWCYASHSHAAEATAGYFNAASRDGYAPFFRAVREVGGVVSFTCVEMRDCEHPPDGNCSPEALLRQIIDTARAHGAPCARVRCEAAPGDSAPLRMRQQQAASQRVFACSHCAVGTIRCRVEHAGSCR